MRTISFLTVIATLILCGCGKTQPKINKLQSDSVILAFGDSLTYGTGASRTESYPAILSEKFNLKVINAGIPGEISGKGLRRIPALLSKYKPGLVILCHGGNDILRRYKRSQLKRNLESIISLIQETDADVILLGVPSPGITLSPPKLYEEIATKYQIPYEHDILSEVLSETKYKSDKIHPNARGYKLIADHLYQLITQLQPQE